MGALGFALGMVAQRVRPAIVTPPYDPSRLFAGGIDGAWYDPDDPATLFQDAAGTVPAAVGAAVGRMLDKSGRGHHASQATAAARPVLMQEAGRRYLSFDGIDDYLLHDFSAPAGNDVTLSSAAQRSGGEAFQGLFSVTPAGSPTRALIWARVAGEHWGIYAGGAWRSAGFDATQRCVMTNVAAASSDIKRLSTNGGAPVEWPGAFPADTIDRRAIGRDHSTVAGRQFAGRFYGAVGIARALNDAELAELIGWQRSAAGIA